MKIGIIGGGASGMMAALQACRSPSAQVILFERQARLGKKLLATGNGRCNLSNSNAASSHYHGAQPDFCIPALKKLNVPNTLQYFLQLGLLTTEELDGKIYPFSNQSNSVVDVLRLALEQSCVQLRLGCEVQSVQIRGAQYLIVTADGTTAVDRLIIACGGLAGKQQGGTNAGYTLLKSLGHHCSKLYPSLVQLRTDPTLVRSLKGVRAEGLVTLRSGKRILAQERGEIQFTDFGISGPCVFSLARYAAPTEALQAELDLCPQKTAAELEALLLKRQTYYPNLTLENYLTGLLHNRLGRTVLRACGLPLNASVSSLEQKDITGIAAEIKCFRLDVLGPMGLDQAQVTAGGILTEEFDPQTMQSRLHPGLFATGEVLDIDGDCGGYNLQWAWSSGFVAGCSAAREDLPSDSHS